MPHLLEFGFWIAPHFWFLWNLPLTVGNQTSSSIFQDWHQQPKQCNEPQTPAPLSSPGDPSRTQLAIPHGIVLLQALPLQFMCLQSRPEPGIQQFAPPHRNSVVEQLHPRWPCWSWPVFWIARNDGHGDGFSSFHIPTGLWNPKELLRSRFPVSTPNLRQGNGASRKGGGSRSADPTSIPGELQHSRGIQASSGDGFQQLLHLFRANQTVFYPDQLQ